MGVKYYTHFVLTGEAATGSDQEFSGVVEVNQATDQRYETKEIEALLARNFDLRSGDVRDQLGSPAVARERFPLRLARLRPAFFGHAMALQP
jgi:hypothetical protein